MSTSDRSLRRSEQNDLQAASTPSANPTSNTESVFGAPSS